MAADWLSRNEAFRDRFDAGRELAGKLEGYRGTDAVVLGLARGGVPVAFEVARALELPLDVFVVRKLGFPTQPELAIGAVASGGTRVLNEEVAREVDDESLERIAAREEAELQRRERAYRDGSEAAEVAGRTGILVDDGLATGASMLAAVRALRAREARAVVVAVPVAPAETCEALAAEADEVVCARTPSPFFSVGSWYENFEQTSDEEVERLLRVDSPTADAGSGIEEKAPEATRPTRLEG
jgi:putative phosphoribosyl transferase